MKKKQQPYSKPPMPPSNAASLFFFLPQTVEHLKTWFSLTRQANPEFPRYFYLDWLAPTLLKACSALK